MWTFEQKLQHAAVEAMVSPILRRPHETDLSAWTIQGLGMLRYRINSNLRLHIWNSDIKSPNIENSSKHTHAWNFQSYVFSGQLQNTIYVKTQEGVVAERYMEQEIECGADGGCTMAKPMEVGLAQSRCNVYRAGGTYYERGDEIHETNWQDTTVTLIYREKKPGKDIAKIYIPVDHGHVAAPSLPVGLVDIRMYCDLALQRISAECEHWGN